MKLLICLMLSIRGTHAVIHSHQYINTATTGIDDFPAYVVVGLLDGQQINYYDSNMKNMIPRQEWVKGAVDADFWKTQTQIAIGAEQTYKVRLDTLQQRFNQTGGGVHVVQEMYGCEWDDETGATEGYEQFGYDGEDFLALDLKNMRWIAPVQQAFITTQRWNSNRALLEYLKHYFNQECIEWLKKYLNYGKSTLQRTVPPTVSLLQKSPSSPVRCHATGFYPNGVMVFWRRDGDQVFEDVDHGEILLNHDGTFQNSVDVPVKPEDWESGKLECVVQLAGIDDDFVTVLTRSNVETNYGRKPRGTVPEGEGSSAPPGVIIGVVAGLGALLLAIGIIAGVFIWKKKTAKKGFAPANTSENGSQGSNNTAPNVQECPLVVQS